jgi:flagellar biosynthetic protein FliP
VARRALRPGALPRVPSALLPAALRGAWVLAAVGALILVLSAGALRAQEIGISLGGTTLTGQSLLLIGLVTVLSLAPGIAVMVTCFPFIVTVLSILRQAIGLQQSPPNMLIVSLALFLTWFIMEPVFAEAWRVAAVPLLAGQIDPVDAFNLGAVPFRSFMAGRIDPETFAALAALRPDVAPDVTAETAPLSVLVPSFMLSEIARAFQIGFLIFLPFLIIDLVVSAVLMSMGMMMVPPAIVALPFKLAFFVVADGWTLVSGALVRSYA